jgi:predicted Rossmann-fold nucleotide-binding protein
MIKYQICVSGAAAGETVTTSHQLAFDLGKAIAEAGHTLLTGATVGLPHYAAMGAKKAG